MLVSEYLLTRGTFSIVLLAANQHSEESTFASIFTAKYSYFNVEFNPLNLWVAYLSLSNEALGASLNLIYLKVCI